MSKSKLSIEPIQDPQKEYVVIVLRVKIIVSNVIVPKVVLTVIQDIFRILLNHRLYALNVKVIVNHVKIVQRIVLVVIMKKN